MEIRGTTIMAVWRGDIVAIGGDGQVTLGNAVALKHTARKVRRLYKDKVLAGFAGATADAMTLFERFEAKLEEFNGNLKRAGVELAKDWRKDKYLRRLEAMLLTADLSGILLIGGTGDIIEPDDGMAGIGSGGSYALAAARALAGNTALRPDEIVEKSLHIAADICVYSNHNIHIETLTQE